MNEKKRIRHNFRKAVFQRDKHQCKVCGLAAEKLDAHHITDRNEMPNGGYVKENGISLCTGCHFKAEVYHLSGKENWEEGFHPDDLYALIGSSYDIAFAKSELT
ncbi:MAG: HNH endonuclease [Bacteroidia bacterium]